MNFNLPQLARYVLGLSWIYHGLFPKLLSIAPLEMEMSSSIGLSSENTILLIKFAGVSEVLFGVVLLVFYRQTALLYLNIAGLVALFAFVLLMTPHIMMEAFNPVTTTIPLVLLSLLLLQDNKRNHSGAK